VLECGNLRGRVEPPVRVAVDGGLQEIFRVRIGDVPGGILVTREGSGCDAPVTYGRERNRLFGSPLQVEAR
jgi:hypothetical protein